MASLLLGSLYTKLLGIVAIESKVVRQFSRFQRDLEDLRAQ